LAQAGQALEHPLEAEPGWRVGAIEDAWIGLDVDADHCRRHTATLTEVLKPDQDLGI
jgi:hypothetical protein